MENENLKQDEAAELDVKNEAEVEGGAPVTASAAQEKPNVYDRIISISCLVILVAGLAVFLFGATNAFGKSLNAFNIVTFILDIFSIKSGKIYVCLAKLAIAIAYIIILIWLIKDLVKGSKAFVKVSKKSDSELKNHSISALYEQAAKTISSFVFFIVFAYALSGELFGGWTIFFLVIATLLYLSVNVLNVVMSKMHSLKGKEAITEFVFMLMRPVFFVVIIYLFAIFILQPAGDNLSYGVQVIFGGYFEKGFAGVMETLNNFLVKDVCYIVNMIIFCLLVSAVCSDRGMANNMKSYVNSQIKSRSKSILIMTAIAAGVSCIVLWLNAANTTFGMDTLLGWLSVLKAYFIPVILLSVGVLLISQGVFEKGAE